MNDLISEFRTILSAIRLYNAGEGIDRAMGGGSVMITEIAFEISYELIVLINYESSFGSLHIVNT